MNGQTLPDLPVWVYVTVSLGIALLGPLLNWLLGRESNIVKAAKDLAAMASGVSGDLKSEVERLAAAVRQTNVDLERTEDEVGDLRDQVSRMTRVLNAAAVLAARIHGSHPDDEDAKQMAAMLSPFHHGDRP